MSPRILQGTEIIRIDPPNSRMDEIRYAARILREGGLVAFPTETVYGLGANALNEEAVRGIFEAKGRPSDNPLIVHVAEKEGVYGLAREVPSIFEILARRFWPGPLTVVLRSAGTVSRAVTGGLDTVAVRMPDHGIALALIGEAGVPVAAPSANLSGRPSPTRAGHVIEDLAGRVDIIIDGGETGLGVESTVLDLTSNPPVILRPGGVTLEDLNDALGSGVVLCETREIEEACKTDETEQAQVFVFEGEPKAVTAKIQEQCSLLHTQGKRVGIMCSEETRREYAADVVRPFGSRENLSSMASMLFHVLRSFDGQEVDVIFVEGVAEVGLGFAIMNRLRKASGGRVIRVG